MTKSLNETSEVQVNSGEATVKEIMNKVRLQNLSNELI